MAQVAIAREANAEVAIQDCSSPRSFGWIGKALTKEEARLYHHVLLGTSVDHRTRVQGISRDATHRFVKEPYPPAGVLARFTYKIDKCKARHGRVPGK